ncbi:unnamed protein product [Phyllotreta striolata]|uniref:Lysosomal Pro-X carboxypeptidase n=1 Tax=Phyllotreta striolata TaxID=444603 RepID=A0A9N9XLY8_PHYSR|nr:unnamed protein product [Phyllotreta striolata]
MRWVLYSTAIFSLLLQEVTPQGQYDVETRYINVPITHFQWQYQQNTFKLRYLINTRYYVRGGPMFAYLGNSGDINVFAQNSGYLFQLAKHFSALLVFIEHRYYGKSTPFTNQSLLEENLKFLTTREVLRDFVDVIEMLKSTYLQDVPVTETPPIIVFGDSFGGSLAAWMRLKYPHLVLGAIVSSAPVKLSPLVNNCECFYDVVTKNFEKSGGEQCVKFIKLSWDVVINITKSKSGMDFLSLKWKLCHRLRTAEDIAKLLDWLAKIYVRLALNNYKYPSDFFVNLPSYPIKVFCQKLTTSKIDDPQALVQHFSRALETYTNYTGTKPCNVLDDLTDYIYNYQQCAELVMPKCSVDSDMFMNKPWSFANFSQDCERVYGISNTNNKWILSEYGNVFNYTSNIVFSQAKLDPYRCYGVNGVTTSAIWAFDIVDGIHRTEFKAPDMVDDNYIITARNNLVKAIYLWLK